MSYPPAISTFPLGNRVAVWYPLAAVRLPVDVNAPTIGSYKSALAPTPPLPPPAMRTFPLDSNVAV